MADQVEQIFDSDLAKLDRKGDQEADDYFCDHGGVWMCMVFRTLSFSSAGKDPNFLQEFRFIPAKELTISNNLEDILHLYSGIGVERHE